MADALYNKGKFELMSGNIDFDANTFKVALVTSTYVPNIDTHHFYSDLTNEVANGNGYTTGGGTLASVTVTEDDTGDRAYMDAADLTWSTSTITARGAVLYKDTGVGTTSPLIAYFDFGTDKSSSSGDFTIQWNASGIIEVA